jgi:hypothetical protein
MTKKNKGKYINNLMLESAGSGSRNGLRERSGTGHSPPTPTPGPAGGGGGFSM